MSGPNSVVVCVNCDDFTNGLDQQVIRDGTVGVRTVENRRATHSQLQSHTKCYRAHETWSLNLLKVCRQIYHEGKHESHDSDLSPGVPLLISLSCPRTLQKERLRGHGWYHTGIYTSTSG